MVRDLLIVTSPTNCDVTSGPVVMRRYANADGDEQPYKTSKTQVSLTFSVNCDRGRIEIDHLYGLRYRGWYCNPEQHSLCRPARPQVAARRPAQLVLFGIAVPTTPAQTVSWSIPIIIDAIIYLVCIELPTPLRSWEPIRPSRNHVCPSPSLSCNCGISSMVRLVA